MKRNYEFTFSQSSIRNLQKELRNYKDNILQQKIDLFTKRLAEKGVEIAQVQIADFDAIFTGELIDSIHAKFGESRKGYCVFYVSTSDESAFFVEFGTGIVGKQSPYPGKLPEGVDWQYATGKTIHQLADGRYGWFYKTDDGNWYFTEGMPSRPFMLNTANELRQNVIEEVAREVFG